MFNSPKLSLLDILGEEYINSVAESCQFLGMMDKEEALKIAKERVDFYPASQQVKNDELLNLVGKQVVTPIKEKLQGATTYSYAKASNLNAAPLGGISNMRIGEDGKLYLIAKSEHYHSSLGHGFNGYKLVENANKLGVLNATHNNTRGYITRLLEAELVENSDGELDRVINLETGSIACEAGIKMMLARFYRLDKSFDKPKHSGKIPVFFVMADNMGTSEANYHGTSIVAQTFRGMWPEVYGKIEANQIYKVIPVEKNDADDFKRKIEKYNTGQYKTAGFIHEIVLMNYGGVLLTEEYLREAYKLCKNYDTPIMVDEIQSCMWYKGMFLYKLYNLKPDFVVIGKGFPGGQYPASKIITTAEMDTLNQFGALVTNGQEELASLTYLITMRFAMANRDIIEENGDYFEDGLRLVQEEFPHIVTQIEGKGHLAAIHFETVENAVNFSKVLNQECIDISAQVYKENCPPAALLKPPIIASKKTLEYLINKIRVTLKKGEI